MEKWRETMARKEFFRDLSEKSRLRVAIVTDRGKVKRFVVQLEALFDEGWTPVARYDTAHGFAHLDILRQGGTQEKIRLQEGDLNKALEIGFIDLLTNVETYISQYKKRR